MLWRSPLERYRLVEKTTSIRWKLVSTYLVLIFLTLVLMDSFIQVSLTKTALEQRKVHLLTQGNIIASRVGPNLSAIDKEHTRMYLEKTVINLSMDLKSRVIVTDLGGKVLVDSYNEYLGKNLLEVQEVAAAVHGASIANQYQLAEVGKVVYAGVPIQERGTVIGSVFLVSSLEDLFKEVNGNIGKFLILSVAAIIVTGIISFFFADLMATPIERLTDVVREVTRGRTEMRAPEGGKDELGKLSTSFNQMIQRLSQIDDQRKQFVSNVSHELRTPLSSMKILSESLLMSDNPSPEVYKEFLGDISQEVDRLNNVINSLLYLVNLEQDGMSLNKTPIYFNGLIRNVIGFMTPLSEQKKQIIIFEETGAVHGIADADRIRQCLINLIANAVKFTPEGGRIDIRLKESREDLIIEVADTGIGIPEEKLPLIFDRFYRVDEARARNTGGSGLGLSISQQIINLHGGHIEVESVLGRGTVFSVFLPHEPIHHESEG